MFEPIPKPTRLPKDAKPLRRKTELRPYKLDPEGKPIFLPRKPKSREAPWRKAVRVDKDPKPQKRLVAKIDTRWIAVRKQWFIDNPPDLPPDYYQCRLCPYAVHIDETTLDHIQPKGTFLSLKYDPANLQPAHGVCNVRKGSMPMEWYEQAYGVGGCNLTLAPV